MALPSSTSLDPDLPAIENEIPAYRAISSLAVASLVFGLISAFSFADWWFLIAAGIAILAGVLAERKIRRYPDVLTGRGLAQAGIALGIIFSVSSATIGLVQAAILRREADAFARHYLKVMDSKSVADLMWYRVPPVSRRGMTPKNVLDQFMKGSTDKAAMREHMGPLEDLAVRLRRAGTKVQYVELEQTGVDRMTPYAFAVYRIEGGEKDADHDHDHAGHDHAEQAGGPEFALIEMKSDTEGNGYNWYVSQLLYPYRPKSHKLVQKPVDDGHGHAH